MKRPRLTWPRPCNRRTPAFLCSVAASYITGTLLSVDAGVQAARATGTFQFQVPTMPLSG